MDSNDDQQGDSLSEFERLFGVHPTPTVEPPAPLVAPSPPSPWRKANRASPAPEALPTSWEISPPSGP